MNKKMKSLTVAVICLVFSLGNFTYGVTEEDALKFIKAYEEYKKIIHCSSPFFETSLKGVKEINLLYFEPREVAKKVGITSKFIKDSMTEVFKGLNIKVLHIYSDSDKAWKTKISAPLFIADYDIIRGGEDNLYMGILRFQVNEDAVLERLPKEPQRLITWQMALSYSHRSEKVLGEAMKRFTKEANLDFVHCWLIANGKAKDGKLIEEKKTK